MTFCLVRFLLHSADQKPVKYGRICFPPRVILEVVLGKGSLSERKGRRARNYAKRKGLSWFLLFEGGAIYEKTACRVVFEAENCGAEAKRVFSTDVASFWGSILAVVLQISAIFALRFRLRFLAAILEQKLDRT